MCNKPRRQCSTIFRRCGCESPPVRGRTMLLCIVVLELCLLYSVLYETVTSLQNPGHFTLFGIKYPYAYEVLLAIILIVTIIINFILFLCGMGKYSPKKKPYVIQVFAFHFIIAIPFYLSGMYLYITYLLSDSSQLSTDAKQFFVTTIDDVTFHFLEDESVNKVIELQVRFCCCGLDGPGDYGNIFKEKGGYNVSVTYHNKTLSCPTAEPRCEGKSIEGCAISIPRRKAHFIFVTAAVGLTCAILAILISPCMYASFEFDRRQARADYIRKWRTNLEAELEKERADDDSDDSISPQVGKKRQRVDHESMASQGGVRDSGKELHLDKTPSESDDDVGNNQTVTKGSSAMSESPPTPDRSDGTVKATRQKAQPRGGVFAKIHSGEAADEQHRSSKEPLLREHRENSRSRENTSSNEQKQKNKAQVKQPVKSSSISRSAEL